MQHIKKEIFISVIIPLYNCKPFIDELSHRLVQVLVNITNSFEIIFVNDNSPGDDWKEVELIAEKESRIKGINLSRNFGQHYAITAGLNYSSGEWVVVMDGDLQDQPEEINKLYAKAQEGFDVVLAKRSQRKDHFLKRSGSYCFYQILSYLTDTQQNEQVANFGIYNKSVINAVLSMKDKVRYFPTMIKWVGFKSTDLEVDHASRTEGKSSYNFKRLLRLALDTIISFSDKPLRLTMKLGIGISGLSFIFALLTFYRRLTGQIEVIGYSSLIISIWFLSGVMITLIGMLGLYVGRIFDQTKERPTFIVSETLNF